MTHPMVVNHHISRVRFVIIHVSNVSYANVLGKVFDWSHARIGPFILYVK